MNRRTFLAACSVATLTLTGCAALHSAPISNATANANPAIDLVDAYADSTEGKRAAAKQIKTNLGDLKASSGSSARLKAIAWVQSKLGTPYLWGGTGTDSQGGRFDCSGLTQAAYASAGVRLPRVAQDQYAAASAHPAWKDLKPGDLVFFGTRWNIHHVGMYLGNGMMIHAPHTGAVVRFNRVHYMSDYYGATRVA
jgi:cell wall-associated NlpC family hydrolase